MENGRRRIKRTYQPAKLFQPPEMATTVGLQNVLPLLYDAPIFKTFSPKHQLKLEYDRF